MKSIEVFILLVLALAVSASNVQIRDKCPKVKPMNGYKIEQLLGNWHLKMMSYITDDQRLDGYCYKNYHSMENADTLRMDIEYFLPNGETFNVTQRRNIDHTRPGVYVTLEERTHYGFLGFSYQKNVTTESTVLYIDDELELRFACTQLDHFWYSEAEYYYYISVKNRNFDSFSKLVPLFQQIKDIPEDLNKLQFLTNDITCKN
ncbi:unnamed protein product [Brachionus calyciflorus]|uniref:Uncharacterized protein n=1 Tax=Brachionus calyciflorus TaxID=104777 RepID=A0A814EA94_9BILA|nr:unnamed protein product [Brachionus calyciflorus]